MTVEFNAKISSMTQTQTNTALSQGANYNAGYNVWIWSASYSSSFSNQVTAKNSNDEKREFSLSVEVKASQDDMPGGMKRVLDILEEAILSGLEQ